MAASTEIVENFHGVYLLVSLNPSMRKRTYIGYTVNPTRRIKQHNKGAAFGGARKTSAKGPWEMVLIVHGFPTEIAGLRFEWAWQNPKRSRRLKHLLSGSGSNLDARLKVMWTMLRVPPWYRLPLSIRWLYPPLVSQPPAGLAPPVHMLIVHGPVQSKACSQKAAGPAEQVVGCLICKSALVSDELSCLNPDCKSYFHLFCLAELFLKDEKESHLIPVEGCCPVCNSCMLWGDLIRKLNGCSFEVTNDNE